MHKDVKKVLVSEEEIEQRCKELGAQITQDYKELNEIPILVSLLKGSVPFLAKLMKYIELDVEIDFMDVSSYEGTESIGDVRIIKDLDPSIRRACQRWFIKRRIPLEQRESWPLVFNASNELIYISHHKQQLGVSTDTIECYMIK